MDMLSALTVATLAGAALAWWLRRRRARMQKAKQLPRPEIELGGGWVAQPCDNCASIWIVRLREKPRHRFAMMRNRDPLWGRFYVATFN